MGKKTTALLGVIETCLSNSEKSLEEIGKTIAAVQGLSSKTILTADDREAIAKARAAGLRYAVSLRERAPALRKALAELHKIIDAKKNPKGLIQRFKGKSSLPAAETAYADGSAALPHLERALQRWDMFVG